MPVFSAGEGLSRSLRNAILLQRGPDCCGGGCSAAADPASVGYVPFAPGAVCHWPRPDSSRRVGSKSQELREKNLYGTVA